MKKSMREIFSDNLKEILNYKNISQNELARRIGVSNAIISKWINKTAYPREEALEALSDFFDVPISQLTLDREEYKEHKEERHLIDNYKQLNEDNKEKLVNYSEELIKEQEDNKNYVPVLGKVAANPDGLHMEENFKDEYVEAPKGSDAMLIVSGDSMEPKWQNGEPVFYRFQPNIENGEFAIVEIDGEDATLKQVKFDFDTSTIVLHSLNPKYKDRVLDPKQVRILGKVIY